jgi:hypothetical protein
MTIAPESLEALDFPTPDTTREDFLARAQELAQIMVTREPDPKPEPEPWVYNMLIPLGSSPDQIEMYSRRIDALTAEGIEVHVTPSTIWQEDPFSLSYCSPSRGEMFGGAYPPPWTWVDRLGMTALIFGSSVISGGAIWGVVYGVLTLLG